METKCRITKINNKECDFIGYYSYLQLNCETYIPKIEVLSNETLLQVIGEDIIFDIEFLLPNKDKHIFNFYMQGQVTYFSEPSRNIQGSINDLADYKIARFEDIRHNDYLIFVGTLNEVGYGTKQET